MNMFALHQMLHCCQHQRIAVNAVVLCQWLFVDKQPSYDSRSASKVKHNWRLLFKDTRRTQHGLDLFLPERVMLELHGIPRQRKEAPVNTRVVFVEPSVKSQCCLPAQSSYDNSTPTETSAL